MSDSSAPRRAELILEALGADTDFRDAVIGDLAEEFALRASWDGPLAARRWYYRESLRVAPYLLRDWWRGLKRKDVGHFAGVIVGSSLLVIALEALLQLAVRGLALAPVPSWVRVLLSGQTRSIVLSRTHVVVDSV
jgi:DNA-binding transcriptional LysR family regulator